MIGGTSGTTNIANTRYVGMFATNLNASEAIVQNIMPAAGTVKNFFVLVETAPVAGRTWTFTLRKNGANTAVTCTVVNPSRTCSDMGNSAAFVAGDLISVLITASATAPAGTPAQWTAQFAP